MNTWSNARARVYFMENSGSSNYVMYSNLGYPGPIALIDITKVGGSISRAYITLNIRYPISTTGSPTDFDYQSVLTHELGHALGLDGSSDREATMYESGRPGETKLRTLEADDIDGIQALYGKF